MLPELSSVHMDVYNYILENQGIQYNELLGRMTVRKTKPNREDLINDLTKAKKIYVYGAGKYGGCIFAVTPEDNVQYLFDGDFDNAEQRGWKGEGWYFWDEADGQYCYGPYKAYFLAKNAMDQYAKTL